MTGARTTTLGMSASATPISMRKLMRFCMVRSTRYSSTRGCASSNFFTSTSDRPMSRRKLQRLCARSTEVEKISSRRPRILLSSFDVNLRFATRKLTIGRQRCSSPSSSTSSSHVSSGMLSCSRPINLKSSVVVHFLFLSVSFCTASKSNSSSSSSPVTPTFSSSASSFASASASATPFSVAFPTALSSKSSLACCSASSRLVNFLVFGFACTLASCTTSTTSFQLFFFFTPEIALGSTALGSSAASVLRFTALAAEDGLGANPLVVLPLTVEPFVLALVETLLRVVFRNPLLLVFSGGDDCGLFTALLFLTGTSSFVASTCLKYPPDLKPFRGEACCLAFDVRVFGASR
mmetsp:Transcript_9139/g.18913  ORF Transcript_9139/g.18913 Transcript_9139/m.18913 type:complete len:350 (+) Transcript_9139:1164-2213(+)